MDSESSNQRVSTITEEGRGRQEEEEDRKQRRQKPSHSKPMFS
jgi:hypothetical protein